MKTALCALLLAAIALPAATTSKSTPAADQQPTPQFALLFTTGTGWDTTRPPNQQQHFATHSANLNRLRGAGVIVAGGRFGEYGLIVVKAPTEDSVQRMLAPDSSLLVRTFKVQVSRWSTIFEGTIQR